MNDSIIFVAALVLTFIGTVLISKKLIPILKSRKMGQTILDIGPRWHKSKEGTPTMGGIAFIAASVIVGIIGEYIAILFAEMKDRPIYIVKDTKNLEK